jgi:hypothetical protein
MRLGGGGKVRCALRGRFLSFVSAEVKVLTRAKNGLEWGTPVDRRKRSLGG